MICNGIDVSKWQGAVDWAAVKNAGIRHAMLRAGYGTAGTDPRFKRNVAGCELHGIHWGAYWYSYATTPAAARQEAARCLQLLAGLTPELPVAYDIEYEPGILALDNAGRTALVKAFLGAVEEAGYYGILYASTDFIRNRLNWRELACYDVWAARENGKLLAYLVTRTVTAQDTGCAAVVRLVDFIGEDTVLPRLGGAIDAIVRRAGAEYIDCYNAGIPAAVWQAAGFTERVEGDGCIIPNYLTPPLRENTEYYYFTNKPENFVLFKADGDQDRPNLT